KGGGTLFVYGIESDWSTLGRLDSLAGFDDEDNSAKNSAERDWIAPHRRLNDSLVTDANPGVPQYAPQPLDPRNGPGGSDNTNVTGDNADDTDHDSVPRGDAPFLMRVRDLGMIVAIRSDSRDRNFTANNFNWSWLF